MKEKRAQQLKLKSLCRICLMRAADDALNDYLIDDNIENNNTVPLKKGIETRTVEEVNFILKSQRMFSIHHTMIGNYLVRDLISNITQLEVTQDDVLPDQICETCLDRLHIANHFRMQFISSSQLLERILPKHKSFSTISAPNDKAQLCCLCPRNFSTELKLLKHVEKKHPLDIFEPSRYSSSLPVSCTACNQRFSSFKELNRHRALNYRKLKIRPFECAHCDAKFTDRGYLSNHLKIHSTLKHYACEYCGFQFTRVDHLKNHIEAQHKDSGHKFSCDICSMKFRLKQNLIVHMRVHTREKRFECSHCNKQYGYLCDLKRHISFHHERSKSNECGICKKTFYSKSNLNVHMKSGHQGLKNFSCEICGQKFSQNITLQKHRKAIHKS